MIGNAARTLLVAATTCAAMAGGLAAAEAPEVLPVVLEGTRIRLQKPDGTWATDQELVGATLVAHDETGVLESFRIDAVEPVETPEAGKLYLYTFSVRRADSGEWVSFCEPDRKGSRQGFPLAGYWDDRGNHVRSDSDFAITCTSGTIGKCVLSGYLPWATASSGESLWPYHQACVRMMRADYCGNGRPHTRDGTLIELWDRLRIQVDTATPGLTFEAAWNEDGAVCLRRTRIPEVATLEAVLAECPEKLAGRSGEARCRESFDDPSVRLLNRSRGD